LSMLKARRAAVYPSGWRSQEALSHPLGPDRRWGGRNGRCLVLLCIVAHLFSISSDSWHALRAALVFFSDHTTVVAVGLYRTMRRLRRRGCEHLYCLGLSSYGYKATGLCYWDCCYFQEMLELSEFDLLHCIIGQFQASRFVLVTLKCLQI
jgi:hypothetical protein